MLHDCSAVVDGFSSLDTPKPPSSHPNMPSANHYHHQDKPAAVEWDWDLEHADRKREAKADSAVHGVPPFHVDRSVLKGVIREKLDCRVGRIAFLSSGASPLASPPCPGD